MVLYHHVGVEAVLKNDWKSILVQFALGGLLVSVVATVARHMRTTKLAALLYTLPITFLPILYFVWRHGQQSGDPTTVRRYVGQVLAGLLVTLTFFIALYVLLAATLRNGSELSGGALARSVALSFVFMAVPMAWYFYWVCDKDSAPGTCSFG